MEKITVNTFCCSSQPATTPHINPSHTGDKWDNRRRQLDLVFQCIEGDGGVHCSLSAGGPAVVKLFRAVPS